MEEEQPRLARARGAKPELLAPPRLGVNQLGPRLLDDFMRTIARPAIDYDDLADYALDGRRHERGQTGGQPIFSVQRWNDDRDHRSSPGLAARQRQPPAEQ